MGLQTHKASTLPRRRRLFGACSWRGRAGRGHSAASSEICAAARRDRDFGSLTSPYALGDEKGAQPRTTNKWLDMVAGAQHKIVPIRLVRAPNPSSKSLAPRPHVAICSQHCCRRGMSWYGNL